MSSTIKQWIKIIPFVIILIIGIITIKSGNLQEIRDGLCCNNLFPQYNMNPNYTASMRCNGIDGYHTTYYICARYWSAYVEYPNTNPVELCDYLPYGEEPPLPAVPVPENFYVSINNDNHPEIHWKAYYVHEYQIYRKKDNGNWSLISSIVGKEEENHYIDAKIILPDGHTYYYKMRGKVYDTYSSFTQIEIPCANKLYLPKKRVSEDSAFVSIYRTFKLIDNYPNPFNPETRIRYFLSSPQNVKLVIFNQRGQLIRTLIDGIQQSGNHIAVWDGKNDLKSDAASGLYICRLQVGASSQYLKIFKLK